MQYRMLKNGKKLSALGMGCMRLPCMKDGSVDEEAAITLIRAAIDGGINYIDTAWPYHGGQSEVIVGKALKDGYRERVHLATKLPSWLIKSREDMDQYLTRQLEKLQTDRIDFYLVHALDRTLWASLLEIGVMEFLDQAIADGRIGHAGFSFHDSLETFKTIVKARQWTFCMIQYNYLDEKYQAGTAGLELATSLGLDVFVMEPLRGGLLARDMSPLAPVWEELNRNEKNGPRSAASWALRWVWNRPEVKIVLSGMNNLEQVNENLATAEDALPGTLSEKEIDLMGRARDILRERMKVPCTGCGYCMPCPSGVEIPVCFTQFNNAFVFDDPARARGMYDFLAGREYGADKCISCGTCLERCPQHIDIPSGLALVKDHFGY